MRAVRGFITGILESKWSFSPFLLGLQSSLSARDPPKPKNDGQKSEPVGGDGGIIAIDKEGNIAAPFNSAGMYRAKIDGKGVLSVGIFEQWDIL